MEEEDPLSGRLPDGVCVVSPGQVITDVNQEEPEAAGSLHTVQLMERLIVHNQLLRFADVEMEVVVRAPRCQGSDLLSAGHFSVAGDQAYDLG